MRERIRQAVAEAGNLEEVRGQLLEVLSEVRLEERLKQPGRQVCMGYVSGIITSDGPEKIEENIGRLAERTDEISNEVGFPVFSAACVFTNEVFERIDAESYPYDAWLGFWREVLGNGLVTDVFMTPRWQESTGARDEEETAKRFGLSVHYWEAN